MIDRNQFALNRITCPSLGLEEFFRLAAEVGLSKVELRNDLPGARIVDGMKPEQALALAERHRVRVITINALQKFNLSSAREKTTRELESMIGLAAAIRCPALVLCPNNDPRDTRNPQTRLDETADALRAFGPLFSARQMLGYVEPLGFAESSLDSVVTAAEAIRRSGFDCYRVVYDTFHHYLGPDTEATIGSAFPVSLTGLIHVSGVTAGLPTESYRDEHRVLPSAADRMHSRGQVRRLIDLGYLGDISFEPFAAEVQRLGRGELKKALQESLAYLAG